MNVGSLEFGHIDKGNASSEEGEVEKIPCEFEARVLVESQLEEAAERFGLGRSLACLVDAGVHSAERFGVLAQALPHGFVVGGS